MGLRFYLFALISVVAAQGLAAESQNIIHCTAQVFESFTDGTSRHEKVPLVIENESSTRITLSADLDGRAFTLSGEKTGPFLVSITEEPDYTKGSITTAEFSAAGRLQLATVNKTLVHKLECFNK